MESREGRRHTRAGFLVAAAGSADFVRQAALLAMNPTSLGRLPRRVLFAVVAITVVAAVSLMVSGFLPPRTWGTFVLPLYFASVLLVLALSYLASGNTLMHHYRTGTVQRETSPTTFWCIVCIHLGLAAVLFVLGFKHLGNLA